MSSEKQILKDTDPGYGFKRKVALPFEQALMLLKRHLREEGLETVTEINMKASLKDALDIDMNSYVILGVCSSKLARDMLMAEKEAGIFLPFNLAIYEEFGQVWIAAVKPTLAVGKGTNPYLEDIAGEAEISIQKAVQKI